MTSLFSFILVLGILIFVHELGHFLLAKLFGVRVLKFSLGFGPRVAGRKWGETEYLISAFPLGGYVKMFGEQKGEEEIAPQEQFFSFSHKSLLQRFFIVAGGPVFNLLFAVVIFFGIFQIAGLPESIDTTKIGSVSPGSVAGQAGLQAGDVVNSIDGRKTDSWEQVSEFIKHSDGRQITIVFERAGKRNSITVIPSMEKVKNLFGEDVGERYMIGITRSDEIQYQPVGPVKAFNAALIHTWDFIYLTFMGIVKMVERVIPASELGGPIRIAELAGQQLKAGWINWFHFMGLLSVNLGVLNLLPIPVLDGGHLTFYAIEGLFRRPISEQVMLWAQKVGIALLASLMIFVFYNDILRLLQQWLSLP